MSSVDKSPGDVTNILQTIRWFRDVVKRSETFKNSELKDKCIVQVDKFINLYSDMKMFNKDYPEYVSALYQRNLIFKWYN